MLPEINKKKPTSNKLNLNWNVIQATEEDASSDEDLDDEAMMKLDKNLSTLFSEHKMRIQAKKDEKAKLQKERTLVRDFRIKVRVWPGRV